MTSSASAGPALAFGLSAGLFTLVAAVLILLAGMFIGALVSVLGSPLGGGLKLLLILVIFFAPFLGPLGWFLFGRGSACRGAR
ncbi:hypothetical protein D5S19_07575 [Amycolatopsis panacis]|uniref:Cardiolipin synthase N-terminal domain-containing protein n=1 Tax=Amycolatopsis panacis TaxID=2340917 RepID=A0A419I8A4_9PSEU|nr:hypothetical protein D5S19_07575 [Amycolatopsis panacis]